MARLRNVQSGAVVSVDDTKVARLGPGWEPADEKPAAKPQAKKAAAAKPSSDDKS